MRSLVSLLLTVPLVIVMIAVRGGPVSFADGNHVEYSIPEPEKQQVVASVVTHGESGLVEVTLDCITPGKAATFVMDAKLPEGSTDLTVRKNSGVDVSGWFSLDPSHVSAPGGRVRVRVEVPSGATLNTTTVTRIQEVGDPPAPGGHNGVKVFIDCIGQNPTATPTSTVTPKPTATKTSEPKATKTPTSRTATRTPTQVVPTATSTRVIVTTSTQQVPTSTKTPNIKLPQTGYGSENGNPTLLVMLAALLMGGTGFVVILRRR